jgi:mRNA interferase RelE/StbE
LFQVFVCNRARKDLKKLPEHNIKKALKLLFDLEQAAVPSANYDVEKLKGYEDSYRIRIGDVRIIYAVKWSEREIEVRAIKPREKAYT